MSDSDVDQPHGPDMRVPVDRMNTTRPGVYYSHYLRGKCNIHGDVMVECIHPNASSKGGELTIECVVCRDEVLLAGGR